MINFSLYIMFFFPCLVVSQSPHLKGNIEISFQNGTFEAELILSDIPRIADYSIWLNAGLNIEYFRSADDRMNYGFKREYSNKSYEAFQYYFPANDQVSRFLPEAFIIKYTGKFPVFADTLRKSDWGDWKGNMAFNGTSFRASEQSAFYPVLYDRVNDIIYNTYTYEITLECKDCTSVYMNGSAPVNSSRATLISDFAVNLLVFAGDFNFFQIDDTYILNADIDYEKQKSLGLITKKITDFYEQKLKIPYGSPVVYLSARPVTKRNSWMFVTYPTIAFVGIPPYRLEDHFDPVTHQFQIDQRLKYIAHELAHYYFGTLFRPNSTLIWFFLEGITEYIALKASKELAGIEVYKNILSEYIKELENFEYIPLHIISSANETDDNYKYKYVPILLVCMEQEFGEEKMWNWLRHLLSSQKEFNDYDFFVKSLIRSGISQKQAELFINQYIIDDVAFQNIKESMNKVINNL